MKSYYSKGKIINSNKKEDLSQLLPPMPEKNIRNIGKNKHLKF